MKNGDLENERPTTSRPGGGARWPFLVGIVAVGALIAGMLYLARGGEEVEEAASVAPPAVEQAARQVLPPLPPASETDALVREALRGISPLGQLAAWLGSEDLVRRFVGATNQIADGKSPRTQLTFLGPQDRFQVVRRGSQQYIDPRGYKRYDIVAQVLGSIDTNRAATVYERLEPLFEQAQQELGARDRTFRQTLAAAIHRLGSTPMPTGHIEVVEDHVTYKLAEPQLEALSGAQKHLLRMGPDNMRLVQLKLEELALALKLPPSPETAALEPKR